MCFYMQGIAPNYKCMDRKGTKMKGLSVISTKASEVFLKQGYSVVSEMATTAGGLLFQPSGRTLV